MSVMLVNAGAEVILGIHHVPGRKSGRPISVGLRIRLLILRVMSGIWIICWRLVRDTSQKSLFIWRHSRLWETAIRIRLEHTASML